MDKKEPVEGELKIGHGVAHLDALQSDAGSHDL